MSVPAILRRDGTLLRRVPKAMIRLSDGQRVTVAMHYGLPIRVRKLSKAKQSNGGVLCWWEEEP